MRQDGFSLVEMMVAMVIGMLVVAATLIIYTGTFGANASQMRYSRINNDLRAVMTQMTRDIRRAEYRAYDETIVVTGAGPLLSGLDCTVYSANDGKNQVSVTYDTDSDGTSETYVYKHEVIDGVGVIRASNDGGANWTNLTDPAVVNIIANGATPAFCIVDTSPAAISGGCGNFNVNVAGYEIILSGRLVRDATAIRTLRETVRSRNEAVAAAAACP